MVRTGNHHQRIVSRPSSTGLIHTVGHLRPKRTFIRAAHSVFRRLGRSCKDNLLHSVSATSTPDVSVTLYDFIGATLNEGFSTRKKEILITNNLI